MPVYFIRSADGTGPIKIGKTGNIIARLNELQKIYGPLQVLGVIDGYTRLETQLHKRFDHLRLEGEWFKPEADLMQFIGAHIRSARKRQKPPPIWLKDKTLACQRILETGEKCNAPRMKGKNHCRRHRPGSPGQ